MEIEFRPRDYIAEESAAALRRSPAADHPLAQTPPPPSLQVSLTHHEKVEFDDPLRVHAENVADSDGWHFTSTSRRNSNAAGLFSAKEWTVFSCSLVQKFSCDNKIPISPTLDIVVRNSKECGKSLADVHMEELDDPQMVLREEKKVVTRQEYASRLQELKAEIHHAWRGDDRVKALKLSIKVARLLMDTTVSQFYPTLFILVIEVLDMLGDLVWGRIIRKAEYSDDGTPLCSLPESFVSGDICFEAKDTCYNWFCKIGSIRELLPRIYLELAIFRCWRFMEDDHFHNLHRLTMMMRGLADPLASAYCHLYMARCAESLNPRETGYLITSISDITFLLERMIANKETLTTDSYKIKRMLITLIEPAIEWIMKCIINGYNKKLANVLSDFGLRSDLSESSNRVPCISVVLHHLLKQLPAELISMNALEIVGLFEQNSDISLDQHLNYRLLGLKLCESAPSISSIRAVLHQVNKVVNKCNCLDEYLIVADAYIDIILQYSMDDFLSTFLDGIVQRAQNMKSYKNEVDVLQSILVKLINNFDRLEDLLSLNHFMGILELLHGSSRNMVDLQILLKATRTGVIRDPTTIQFLFEISQTLHDSIDVSEVNNDQQRAHLISTFVQMVDFGVEAEHHLTFLTECRAAFGQISELKEPMMTPKHIRILRVTCIQDTLVHLSNNLAVKAIKTMKKYMNFLKACISFNEVTIPSISCNMRCMNLYLETAEVALLGGLISHTEGLINSAISCLQNLNTTSGFQKSLDIDQVTSLSCKLCSILVMVPGIHEEGVTSLPRNLISVVDCQSLTSSRVKMKILCAIISLSASLSQNKLPYFATKLEAVSNDQLFFGYASHRQELLSISSLALQRMIGVIEEEPHSVTRGKVALEACNCLIISFKASHQLHLKCTQLVGIAKSCLRTIDKHLESTIMLFDKHFSNL